jgi:hypothetical protein
MHDFSAIRTGSRVMPIALWLCVMAAMAIEAVALIVRTAAGDFTSFLPYLADLGRVATRALVVAGSIGITLVVARCAMRPLATAAVGAVCGPLACLLGRALSGGVCGHLGLPALEIDPGALVVLAVVRSVEFGALGFIVGLLAARRAPVSAFAWGGLAVAIVFGVALVAVRNEVVLGRLTTSDLVAFAVEELAFPVSIALILAGVAKTVEESLPRPA